MLMSKNFPQITPISFLPLFANTLTWIISNESFCLEEKITGCCCKDKTHGYSCLQSVFVPLKENKVYKESPSFFFI